MFESPRYESTSTHKTKNYSEQLEVKNNFKWKVLVFDLLQITLGEGASWLSYHLPSLPKNLSDISYYIFTEIIKILIDIKLKFIFMRLFNTSLLLFFPLSYPLNQRFSTWGTRTPGGTRGVCRGYAKF